MLFQCETDVRASRAGRVPQGDVPFSIQVSLFPGSEHYAKTTFVPAVAISLPHFHAGGVSARHEFSLELDTQR